MADAYPGHGCWQPVRLETERLILDGHRAADLESLASIWSDPAILEGVGAQASGIQESWMRLLRYRGLWPVLGYGYWAVREKASGRHAGDLGFADFRREVEPSIDGIPEAGWVLAGWAQGHGYAVEALGRALDWLDREAGIDRCVCLINPGNARSVRLARRHGFVEQNARFRDKPTLLMSRRRETLLSRT